MNLDPVQQAAQEQFARQSQSYGSGIVRCHLEEFT
jgi:hypothetical protein